MNDQLVRQRFPTWKQALLILAAGIVLALSSSAAFLGTVTVAWLGRAHLRGSFVVHAATLFFAGVAVTIFGLILVLIRAIRGPATRSGPDQSGTPR